MFYFYGFLWKYFSTVIEKAKISIGQCNDISSFCIFLHIQGPGLGGKKGEQASFSLLLPHTSHLHIIG